MTSTYMVIVVIVLLIVGALVSAVVYRITN